MILGSVFARKRIKKIGNKAHVTESNLTNLVAFLIWGFRPDWVGSYIGMSALAFGMRKRDGLESLMIGEGDKIGWGKGETTAYLARPPPHLSIVSTICPVAASCRCPAGLLSPPAIGHDTIVHGPWPSAYIWEVSAHFTALQHTPQRETRATSSDARW